MSNEFVKYIGKIYNTSDINSGKRANKISINFKVKNVQGAFNITDIMFQESEVATGYTINTKEMIEESTDDSRHYNILIRGTGNGIIVNNDGDVSSGLNFDVISKNGTTGPMNIETLYKTKHLQINEIIEPDTKLLADSFSYTLDNNGDKNRNYKGSFLGIPSVFGLYNIDMNNRDCANFVFKVKAYNHKDRY